MVESGEKWLDLPKDLQMLIGTYPAVLGEKRRVTLPKKFLEELGNTLILAKWYEDCLILVKNEFWEKLLDRLTGGKKALGYGVRDIERFILGSAFQEEPDGQGRIIIPEILAKYAGLNKDLVFVGLMDKVEIWDKRIWDKKSEELAKTTKEYVEQIS
jgi:MraZ protein